VIKYSANVSTDGMSFKQEDQELLLGSYFFFSDALIQYNREPRKLFAVISDLGGLIEIIYSTAAVFVVFFSSTD
jgi:hypothetical protein